MNAHTEQFLIEKLKTLPPQRRAEVEDFIDFLQHRESDRQLVSAAAHISEPAFKAVWANDQDAAYGQL
jgi:hypothetical protein